MEQHEHPWTALFADYRPPNGWRIKSERNGGSNGHPIATPAAGQVATDTTRAHQYLANALAGECDEVRTTPEGGRNHRLNVAAFKVGQLLHLNEAAELAATDALTNAGLASGLGAGECRTTIASGLAAGQAEPREVTFEELPDTTLPALGEAGEASASRAPTSPDAHGELDPQQVADQGEPSAPSAPANSGELAHGTDEAARAAALAAYHQRCVEEEVRRLTVRADGLRVFNAGRQGALPEPELIALTDLLSRPRRPVRWRIDGWLPTGSRVLVVAQYKAGKTTLVGNLVRSLVDGSRWLGRHEVNVCARRVVLLDFEMSTDALADWLRDQRIENTDAVTVVPLRGLAASFDILDPATRSEWAARLRALAADFLILDCLRPVLDALALDEHSDAGRFLVAFDALLTEAGIAESAAVHHMGHAGERSRGDSRLRDWPDVEWRVVRENDDPASPRYITAFGRDVDVSETQMTFDPSTRHIGLAGGSRADARARAALFDVLAVLQAADHGLSGRQVEAELADSPHTQRAVREALHLGVRLGSMVATPGAKRSILYTLPA